MSDSNAASAADAPQRTIRIVTGARLHFGLLDTVAPFGGLGVMIDAPSTEVVVERYLRFVCAASERSRIEPIAKRIARAGDFDELPDCRVEVARCAESHCGLGSGTQLSLAAAEAISRFVDQTFTPEVLAVQLAERGKRSAVGIHGYFRGGMIFERGQESKQLNSIHRRTELPSNWCVAVFRPRRAVGEVSGDVERDKFAQIKSANPSTVRMLDQWCTERILPAAERSDFAEFSRSVQEYNHASGMLFADVQGGAYNGEAVRGLVDQLGERGAAGIGQSSWGPGVFTWFESRDEAASMASQMPDDVELITIAQPLNQPRQIFQVA